MGLLQLFRYWRDPDAVVAELEKSEEMIAHLQKKMNQFPKSLQWRNMYEKELKKSIPIKLRADQLRRRENR